MYLWYGHDSIFLNYYYHTAIEACYTSLEINSDITDILLCVIC